MIIEDFLKVIHDDFHIYGPSGVLVQLYHIYSEEIWAASWEDDMEGDFVKWLKENGYITIESSMNEQDFDVNLPPMMAAAKQLKLNKIVPNI